MIACNWTALYHTSCSAPVQQPRYSRKLWIFTDGTLFGWVLKIVILCALTVFTDHNSWGSNTSTSDFANKAWLESWHLWVNTLTFQQVLMSTGISKSSNMVCWTDSSFHTDPIFTIFTFQSSEKPSGYEVGVWEYLNEEEKDCLWWCYIAE